MIFSSLRRRKKYKIPNVQKAVSKNQLKIHWQGYFYCFYFLLKNRKKIHHVEIYPGGKLSILFVLLSKIFKLKSVLAERGDIGCINNYSNLTRWSMEQSYKFSDHVWFREHFMEAEFRKRAVSNLFFQGNAIKMPNLNIGNIKKSMIFFG